MFGAKYIYTYKGRVSKDNKDNDEKYFRYKRSNKKTELCKYTCLLKEKSETPTIKHS